MVNIYIKKIACLPFHYLWACGYNERMWEAGSIQCNYTSPQPVFLAIPPGSFFWKDENIGRRVVQWVKYRQELMCHLCAHMQRHTRLPVGWLASADCGTHAGLHFFQCSTHRNIFQRELPAQLFVPTTKCEDWFCHSPHHTTTFLLLIFVVSVAICGL